MSKPDLFRISEELEAMPEIARVDRIEIHKMNYFIFVRNAEDLRGILNFHGDIERSLTLRGTSKRNDLYALQKEVGRLLHNFVAAASSLIDTTRRLSEKYNDKDFPDYQAKIEKEFKTDPLAQFVVGLRNYTVHYQAPPVISHLDLSFGENPSMTNQIVMPSALLLKFSGWKEAGKRYISHCGDQVVLNTVVNDYCQKISEFYDWFYTRLTEIHKSDLERIAAKKQELKKAHYEYSLNFLGSYMAEHYQTNETPNRILDHILAPDDLAEIMAINAHDKRADATIKKISEFIELPAVFVEAIKNAFANYNW